MLLYLLISFITPVKAQSQQPNILFVMSDDHSFPHASEYGSNFIETPAIDRVADEGILFMNAWAAASNYSPSRATIITGRYLWQIEQAGTHDSTFPNKYEVFLDLLEEAGYWIGYTG